MTASVFFRWSMWFFSVFNSLHYFKDVFEKVKGQGIFVHTFSNLLFFNKNLKKNKVHMCPIKKWLGDSMVKWQLQEDDSKAGIGEYLGG